MGSKLTFNGSKRLGLNDKEVSSKSLLSSKNKAKKKRSRSKSKNSRSVSPS